MRLKAKRFTNVEKNIRTIKKKKILEHPGSFRTKAKTKEKNF